MSLPASELTELLATARDAARAAAAVHREHFRRPDLAVERKADATPVTVADRDSEQAIREVLRLTAPGFAIKGEEFGEEPGRDGQTRDRWIIDPIDGTKNFVRGLPLFASLIGLQVDGEVEVGVVHAPMLGASGESWFAHRGGGAWHADTTGERQIHVSPETDLGKAGLAMGGLNWFTAEPARWEALHALASATAFQRGFGDWWGHMLVADGRMELMLDPVVEDYDVSPIIVVVEEAGGRFTSVAGERRIDGGHALSSNGPLHDSVLKLVAGAWR